MNSETRRDFLKQAAGGAGGRCAAAAGGRADWTMKRSAEVLLFALAMYVLACPVCLAAGESQHCLRASSGISPFDVGSKAQLFVDRILVHQTDRAFWGSGYQMKFRNRDISFHCALSPLVLM